MNLLTILISGYRAVHPSCQGIWRFVGGGGRQMPLEQPIQTLWWSKPALYPGAKREGAVYNKTTQDGNKTTVVGEHSTWTE